jgi:3-hydroxyacyl-CoA dehydrogenase
MSEPQKGAFLDKAGEQAMRVSFEISHQIAVLRIDNPPLNALGYAVRHGICEALEAAVAGGARAVLIYCAGRTWCAGADIKEFGHPPQHPILPDVCAQIEARDIPVVGAMHGTVLGGGLELSLACHYRLATPTAQFGLPEVNLGLIPGAGGTQRLPRLIAMAKAAEMVTTGRPIGASEAHAAGLLDAVCDGDPMDFGLAFARDLVDQQAKPRPVGMLPMPTGAGLAALRESVAKRTRGQRAPVAALDALEAATRMEIADGLAEERRIFRELMDTDQSKSLIHAFFAERQAPKLPELSGVTPRACVHLGIVGGGTMGAGIATAALLSGMQVTLVEMAPEVEADAKRRIAQNLEGALKRGKIDQAAFQHLMREALTTSTDDTALHAADVIIEAVFEDMAVKHAVFAALDRVAKPGAILASNTSYLDINEIAAGTARPADMLGLHFFSPAHVMKLLEVVVGDATAPDVVATGFAFAKQLGKIAVRAGVCDGFIGNRILNSYRMAVDHMVLDGVSPFQIDAALERFGFAMGPFAVADLAGLDIGWANRKRLMPFRDPRERVSTYADRLCADGHFGRKTGRGYYIYDGKTKTENPDVAKLIAAERAALGITPMDLSDDEIIARYMAAMVNEAAKVVGEGIARRPLDVDVVLVHGYGFPRFHGGPLKWADLQGPAKILSAIKRFAVADPYFWRPAPLLEELVAQDRLFESLNKRVA